MDNVHEDERQIYGCFVYFMFWVIVIGFVLTYLVIDWILPVIVRP